MLTKFYLFSYLLEEYFKKERTNLVSELLVVWSQVFDEGEKVPKNQINEIYLSVLALLFQNPDTVEVFHLASETFKKIGLKFDEDLFVRIFDAYSNSAKIPVYLKEIMTLCKQTD